MEKEIESQFRRLNEKLDGLYALPQDYRSTWSCRENAVFGTSGSELFFRQFTAKQNAAMQMVLRGAENQEIASRLGVTENTAKVHVRVIAKKMVSATGCRSPLKRYPTSRTYLQKHTRPPASGLPKDWDQNFQSPDPWEPVYRGGPKDAIGDDSLD